MSSTNMLWIARGLWLILPFTAGPLFGDALDASDRPYQLAVSIGLWVVWAALLVVLMIPRTQTLTAVRVVAPAGFVVAIWAALTADASGVVTIVALLSTGAAAIVALSSPVGDAMVDGASYGDESRFLLRTPGALLVGPIQLVWAAIAVGLAIGPVLLAAQQWIIGVIALIAGWVIAYFAIPILHRLSERWLVFVPAGLVVHDKTALREPQLFRKESIAAFGPAPADSELEDLSLNGLGLALRATLKEASKIVPNQPRAQDQTEDDASSVAITDIDGFIVSPNRPGAVVDEAKGRGITIG